MPLSFAVIEPKDYASHGLPAGLRLDLRMPALNTYLTNRADGRLQSGLTVEKGEIFAVLVQGSVDALYLPRFLQRLGRPAAGNRMGFPTGPFVWPRELGIGHKLCSQAAPYAAPIISIKPKWGQTRAWQTAFLPDRPCMIVEARGSGRLVATLNLPADRGFTLLLQWMTRYIGTDQCTRPHVRLLVYRLS